jgi:hypothetical protein
MIVEKQVDIQVFSDGEDSQATIAMSLDQDSQQMLMLMLSKNLYADGIGSAIRETTSNALDSMRRSGVVDVPIIVSMGKNDDDNYEFCVEDFGSGLDDKDVENVISKYGKSTKRSSATELGMFGLGFKSPLAYSSSFIFVCRKEGVERKYMMYEGDEQNTIDLLHEAPTVERNGVKVIIPVKFSDRNTFYDKIKEQLAYFDSVYFDVPGCSSIDNEFTIDRGDLYQSSGMSSDPYMHICLDNVYYPIDFSKLGIAPLTIPLGLRFTLTDGLYPTPNRESLRYTTESKKTILDRIKLVSDNLVALYNNGLSVSDDAESIFNFYNTNNRILSVGTVTMDIRQLLPYASIDIEQPVFSACPNLDMKRLAYNYYKLMENYQVKYEIGNGRFTEAKSQWRTAVSMGDFAGNNFIMSEKLCSTTKTYLREVNNTYKTVKVIKKQYNIPLMSAGKVCYHKLLNLSKYPKDQWRTLIKEYQYLQGIYVAKLTNFETFAVPQDWLDAKKIAGVSLKTAGTPRPAKELGDVIGRVGVPLLRSVNQKYSKLEPITLKLSELDTHDFDYVYGSSSESDIDTLDRIYHLTTGAHKIKTLVFSDRELKVLSAINIPNLIPLEKFMDGQHTAFRKIVTGALISNMMYKYQYVFTNRHSLADVSANLLNELEELAIYKSNNFINTDTKLIEAMIALSEDKQLFDDEMYPKYVAMAKLLDELKFLDPVLRTMSPYLRANIVGGTEMLDVIRDLCTFYNYPIDPVPVVVEEEVVAVV